MNRLTKKDKNGKYFSIAESIVFDEEQQCIDKLGKLEDIEEKLKIELPVFVAACLRNKIYSKFWDKYVYFTGEEDAITTEGFVCYTSGQNELYRYEDYGKTWALTEEELEVMNDKVINTFKETYVIYVQLEDNRVYALALDIMEKYKYKIVDNFLYEKGKKLGKIVKFLEREEQ